MHAKRVDVLTTRLTKVEEQNRLRREESEWKMEEMMKMIVKLTDQSSREP